MVAVSSLCCLSAPLPAVLAVQPRWSDVLVRTHCCLQALNAVVAVAVFCLVAPEPRSACRSRICGAGSAAGGGGGPSSRRTSAGSINRCRGSADRPTADLHSRLFHVPLTDGEAEAAAVAGTPTRAPLDAECLLPQTSIDVTSPTVDDDLDTGGNDVTERRLASEQNNASSSFPTAAAPPFPPCQRTRLLGNTANFPDDVLFAHTSV